MGCLDGVVGDAGSALEGTGGCGDEADVPAGAGCFRHEGEEVFQEEGVAHVVGAELHLVAVCGQRWGETHDAGVGKHDVDGVEVGEEFLDGGFDGM